MAEPLISIIIPAYNYAHLLPRAVQSVLPQLNSQTELLVIDDGSTDATQQVLLLLHEAHPDRFRSIYKPNGGLASTRNAGIELSHGQWLIFLDADDELVPGILPVLINHIAQHPHSRMVIGGHSSVFPSGKQRQHKPGTLAALALERVRDYLLHKKLTLSNGACVMHREVFGAGKYPERFRNVEDIPVFSQVLAHFPVTTIEEPVALIHKHDDSLRHNMVYAKAIGLDLVDEVFRRLPPLMQSMRSQFYVQRSLSLFRSAYLAGDGEQAKYWFLQALRKDWAVIFKLSYSRKAIKLWLTGIKAVQGQVDTSPAD